MKRKASPPPPPPPPGPGSLEIDLVSESEPDSDEDGPRADVLCVGGTFQRVDHSAHDGYLVIVGSSHTINVTGNHNHIAVRCTNTRITVSGAHNTVVTWGPLDNVVTFARNSHHCRLHSLDVFNY